MIFNSVQILSEAHKKENLQETIYFQNTGALQGKVAKISNYIKPTRRPAVLSDHKNKLSRTLA